MDLPSLLAGTEVVFHLAGQPGVRSSWGSEFDRYVTDNVRAPSGCSKLLCMPTGSDASCRVLLVGVWGRRAVPDRGDRPAAAVEPVRG